MNDVLDSEFYTRDTVKQIAVAPPILTLMQTMVLFDAFDRIRSDGSCIASDVAPSWRSVEALCELRELGMVILTERAGGRWVSYEVELTLAGVEYIDGVEPRLAS